MEVDQVSLKSLFATKGDEILETIGIQGKTGDAAGFLQQLLGELDKFKGKSEGEGDVEVDLDAKGQLADLVGKILPQKETDLPADSEILESMEKGLLSEEKVDEIPLLASLSDTVSLERVKKVVRQFADVSDRKGSAVIGSTIPATAVGIEDADSESVFNYQSAGTAESGGDAEFSLAADLDAGVDNDRVSYALAQEAGLVQKSEAKVDGQKIATLDAKPIADRLVESSGYTNSESGFTKDKEARSNMANSTDVGELPEKILARDNEVSITPKVVAQALPVVPGVVATPANNLAVAGNSIQPGIQSPLGQQGWDQEFGEQVAWMTRNSLHTAELRLNPRHLGPVEVRIQMNQDQAEIVFSSQHSVVREAIEAALPKLRETFMAQQIDLRDVNVSQQTFSEQREFKEQKGETPYAEIFSGGGNAGDTERLEETVTQGEMNQGLVSYYV